MPRKTAPQISDNVAEFYETSFRNLNAGATFTLETFPCLYKRTLYDLKGQFTKNELCLIIDIFNGLALTPQIVGQHLCLEVKDGIELENLGEKWSVKKVEFLAKLNQLSLFEKASLEVWAKAFWDGKREGQEGYQKTDLDEYVKELS